MLTPSQQFNEHATKLTQQQRRHELAIEEKIKKHIEDAKQQIKQELNVELALLSQTLATIEQKLKAHFGPP